jgi:hypothetical protein
LLNNVQTINGYDQDEGPAKLIILPSNKEVWHGVRKSKFFKWKFRK